ncbi:glycosyltransferase family 2 protein [Olsenella sp. An188]|uniref:glycosyltransferase family 2 protein n=1 Tax=Olsenella sp. An188 TaxID=1965579 RepID=UPI000B37C1A9|nr:glycosyltransferase family A protein [Olsenella sp. An188]OUP38143.1 hypothetical protein B5F23_07835 [Olsenella sp. An188]
MSDEKLVSVIIPTYNRANTISESIQSVLAQTYRNLEILVIDDGSTDNTCEVVKSIRDSRVRYERQDNAGACSARNAGINLASGDYIAFQDSDDLWESDKLMRQVLALDSTGADVCICKMLSVNMLSGAANVVSPRQDGISLEALLKGNFISTQMVVARAECFNEVRFDERLKRLQDWDLGIQLIKRYVFTYVPEVLVTQRILKDSITSKDELLIPACKYIHTKYQCEYSEHAKSDAVFLAWLGELYKDTGSINALHSEQCFRASLKRSVRPEVLAKYISIAVSNRVSSLVRRSSVQRGR